MEKRTLQRCEFRDVLISSVLCVIKNNQPKFYLQSTQISTWEFFFFLIVPLSADRKDQISMYQIQLDLKTACNTRKVKMYVPEHVLVARRSWLSLFLG